MREFHTTELLARYIDSRKLDLFLAEVKAANRHINLFSRQLTEIDLRRMVAESLIPIELGWLEKKGLSLLDVGSGWGIPAIPLLLANLKPKITLLERSEKKANFLRLLLQRLQLSGQIENSELKGYHSDDGFQVFTLRRVILDDDLLNRLRNLAGSEARLLYFGPPPAAINESEIIDYSIDRLPSRTLIKMSI